MRACKYCHLDHLITCQQSIAGFIKLQNALYNAMMMLTGIGLQIAVLAGRNDIYKVIWSRPLRNEK